MKLGHWFGVVILGLTTLARADPKPTLVAPRAVLLDPNDDDKVLMSKDLDSKALQGSIAKLMTAYTASWAVRKGYADWSDVVTLSARAAVQGCSCVKYQVKPNPAPATGCSSTSTTQAGDQFKLEDLLQVTLNQSTGESTDAIAEFIARKVYKLKTPKTQADSDHLMDLFIGLMNKRAKELKLDHSTWITVHGGDTCDFAEGCDPKCTPDHCAPQPCGACGGGTTVHDLALLWHALTRDEPKFLGLIGVRGFELETQSGSVYNSYGHGFGYYPGVDADKNGASGACPEDPGSSSASCHIAQATRGGHPLIGAVLQAFKTMSGNKIASGASDVAAMLRWGFREVLKPERLAEGYAPGTDKVKDHALACEQASCYSALRLTNDSFKLLAWQGDPVGDGLRFLSSSVGPNAGYTGVTSVDVDANMLGALVAMVSKGKLVLGRWWLTGGPSSPGLPPNIRLSFIGDSGSLIPRVATLVRVRAASPQLAVTAARTTIGTLRLSSWSLGSPTPTAAVRWLADGTSTSAPNAGTDGELVLATAPDPDSAGDFLAVTGVASTTGVASLTLWRVTAAGVITFVKTQALPVARHLSLASDGTGKFGVSFTTGSGDSGPPRVETWDVAHDGTFTRTLGWTETTAATSTAIAPLGPPATKSGISAGKTLSMSKNTYTSTICGSNGTPRTNNSQRAAQSYLAAAGRGTGATLSVWDSPKHYDEIAGSIDDYRIVDSGSAWGHADNIRLAAIPNTDPLLNRYLSQQVGADGILKLFAWRVGSATPSHPHLAP